MDKRKQNLPSAEPAIRDPLSYAKARADWADVQEIADRRYQFTTTKRAYLQTQSARITRNIDYMVLLERNDELVFGRAACDEAGRGSWPYA